MDEYYEDQDDEEEDDVDEDDEEQDDEEEDDELEDNEEEHDVGEDEKEVDDEGEDDFYGDIESFLDYAKRNNYINDNCFKNKEVRAGWALEAGCDLRWRPLVVLGCPLAAEPTRPALHYPPQGSDLKPPAKGVRHAADPDSQALLDANLGTQ